MHFLVLAYPELSARDYQLIQNYRQSYDRHFALVDPHFTFVFPFSGIPEEEFKSEVLSHVKNVREIKFSLDDTLVHTDNGTDYYEFLVPSEGYLDIELLHKKLYSEKLEQQLDKSIKFVPHITIGHSDNLIKSTSRLDTLRQNCFPINGRIRKLSVVCYSDLKLGHLSEIDLKRK